jgi:hypothetical protein
LTVTEFAAQVDGFLGAVRASGRRPAYGQADGEVVDRDDGQAGQVIEVTVR